MLNHADPLVRRVAWNSALWTAGNLLTTGGFLTYFVREYRVSSLVMVTLLVIPETAGILGLTTPWLVSWAGSRRTVWWIGQLVARGLTLLVPAACLAFGPISPDLAGWHVVALVGMAAVAQSVSFNALFSWLADLIPAERWGQFFAWRQVAQVGLLLCLAAPAGMLRDYLNRHLAIDSRWLIYAPLFAAGVSLQLLAMVPLWRLPDPGFAGQHSPFSFSRTAKAFRSALITPSLVRWLAANWWLAFFSGLTQSAFFHYRVDHLAISLSTWYVLEAVLRGTQIPVSLVAGRASDRGRDLAMFRLGVIVTGLALVFYMTATKTLWWTLFGAQICFGFWACVNVAGPNLTLRIAGREENTAHLALLQNGAGLLAGIAGILGDWWLQRTLGATSRSAYQSVFVTIFAISLVGRWASLMWLPARVTLDTAIAPKCRPDDDQLAAPPHVTR